MTQTVTGFRSVSSRRSEAISSSSAVPILLSSSLVHAVIRAPPSSELDQDLDRFTFVHCPVAIRHFVEADDPIKDSTRFDHAAQADGAVSDNGHCLPRANFGSDHCMMACCHHV